MESAPDLQHFDMTLGGANSFKQAEGLEDPDDKDFGNIMALYQCQMAQTFEVSNPGGPQPFPQPRKISPKSGSHIEVFKLQSTFLLSEQRRILTQSIE